MLLATPIRKGLNMKHRAGTPEGVRELRMLFEGERVSWVRKAPSLNREMTIFPETLTPEQVRRLDQIEPELLAMAYEANEEKTTKTVLK